ncbi:flagellar FlbD family protein [Microbacterium sp. NE2HP2]|uniref:flagellar FlbD family protein n=1 Tax=Microbacterium TaxID=33882 RepID=UPI0022AF0E39|nr:MULTISPECIES: flagellar FlbD family protein [Microbacterium]MCZ4068666.1 flagellar FlbD family protein [Microbacterium sp. H37-C3]MDD7945940.1 flagellar FlbD family protein [Microbacterium plantarum]
MIVLTRLNRHRFAVNPDLVERIQASPDTTLTLVDGATFVVAETMDAVIQSIVEFRARVLATALGHAAASGSASQSASTAAAAAPEGER